MLGLTPLDAFAFAWFAIAWAGYSWLVDVVGARRGLTSTMAVYRQRWMHEMLHRSNRIVDGQINMTLQQGTAFFASTSLLAVGGGLTLIGATDRAVEFVQTLPFGYHPSREQWEVKVAGLTIIFVYAFFKFAWAYRLFNYCAILIGATPDGDRRGSEEAIAMAGRAAKMNAIAAGHFNRGQRAFFFALGYLGWFAGPIVLIVTTAAVVDVYKRQDQGDARRHVPVLRGALLCRYRRPAGGQEEAAAALYRGMGDLAGQILHRQRRDARL